jgi:hypothetical protein
MFVHRSGCQPPSRGGAAGSGCRCEAPTCEEAQPCSLGTHCLEHTQSAKVTMLEIPLHCPDCTGTGTGMGLISWGIVSQKKDVGGTELSHVIVGVSKTMGPPSGRFAVNCEQVFDHAIGKTLGSNAYIIDEFVTVTECTCSTGSSMTPCIGTCSAELGPGALWCATPGACARHLTCSDLRTHNTLRDATRCETCEIDADRGAVTLTLSCTDLGKGPWEFAPVGNIVWKSELESVP